MSETYYLLDKPVESKAEDKFQRYEFSKRIAKTIMNRNNKDGIVIGIHGSWGEGKTSVLNFIKSEIEQREQQQGERSILTLTFNPWRYNDEESLIKHLLHKVVKVLGEKLYSKMERSGNFIEKYGVFTSLIGRDISQIGNMLSKVGLETLKDRVDELLEDRNSQLVIFVDDIDRLDKQEIYSLFRLIKLTADFKNTTYVISFDKKMVASAIGERFGEGDINSGYNFLEKIIQVPLQIPQAQPHVLQEYCMELVLQALKESEIVLSDKELQLFYSDFDSKILLHLKTPRLAISYYNSLSFALPLLKGEVNYSDLMLIEGIKIFYPNHYSFIRDFPNYFISHEFYCFNSNSEKEKKEKEEKEKELEKKLKDCNSDLSTEGTQAISYLLEKLFPLFERGFYDCPYGGIFHDEGIFPGLYTEKKIGSKFYFERYFTYNVIKGDISDIVFEDFIKSLERMNIEDTKKEIKNLVNKSSAANFLFKAINYKYPISWKAVEKLTLSIAAISELFIKGGEKFFGMDSYQEKAVNFICDLLKRHKDKDEIFELAKTLIGKEMPSDFADRFYVWMQRDKESEENLFTKDQHIKLDRILRKHLLEECDGKPIYKVYPDKSSAIFSIWIRDDQEELKNYLKQHINQDPKEFKKFFSVFGLNTDDLDYTTGVRRQDIPDDTYEYLGDMLGKDYLDQILAKA